MRELLQQIPDVSLLLALAPEELGAKMLFLMRARRGMPAHQTSAGSGEMFMLSGLEAELWLPSPNSASQYPRAQRREVAQALGEAWAWLEAQGLLIPAPDSNSRNGYRVLTRRARKMETEKDFANYQVTRLLPKENLHRKIADVVWGAFVRGEFDSAAFHAMKGVEVYVRAASGLGKELVGTKLMRKAFDPENGPLTDASAEGGERVGCMELFAGAIGSYKNAQSHRDVNLDDPLEALEIIYLANHLLRIVDARAEARKEAHSHE